MKLDKINYTYEIGKEEILDQILYSYTEAYGLDGADEVDIYLPGAPVDQLPEEFLQWACSNYDRLEAEENGLPCYGLYNVEGAEGFSGYDSVDTAKTYVENTEKAAKELEDSLQNDSLSQGDVNEKSQELYEDWDDALNHIWYELKVKGVLTEDAMAKLLVEQRAWIKDKEAAVQEAGKEAEGGSLQPLLENTEAAKWTRERTYVLLNILLEAAGPGNCDDGVKYRCWINTSIKIIKKCGWAIPPALRRGGLQGGGLDAAARPDPAGGRADDAKGHRSPSGGAGTEILSRQRLLRHPKGRRRRPGCDRRPADLCYSQSDSAAGRHAGRRRGRGPGDPDRSRTGRGRRSHQ